MDTYAITVQESGQGVIWYVHMQSIAIVRNNLQSQNQKAAAARNATFGGVENCKTPGNFKNKTGPGKPSSRAEVSNSQFLLPSGPKEVPKNSYTFWDSQLQCTDHLHFIWLFKP